MRVAAAFDHRGVKLREAVLETIAAGDDPVDLGTDTDAVRIDYPDQALAVAMAIRRGEAERGVLVCGSGVGASIAASKIPGIRAAICHDSYSAHQGVEHDDMNVLCLGSEIVGPHSRGSSCGRFSMRTLAAASGTCAASKRCKSSKGCPMAKSRLHELSAAGVSVWIDSLSREMLASGELARLMRGGRRRRRHLEPDDLPEGALGGRPL